VAALPRSKEKGPSGLVSDVKTKYSNAGMPLDPALAEVLLNWRRETLFKNPEEWVFASPFKAGNLPWYPGEWSAVILFPQAFVAVSDELAGTRSATFRALLDETGVSMKVQRELMRHADIRTLMQGLGQSDGCKQTRGARKFVRIVLASKVAQYPLVPLEGFAIGLKRRK
jgi:hypothetical protein